MTQETNKITTMTSLHPLIQQSFSSALLLTPMKLCHDEETLMKLYNKILSKIRPSRLHPNHVEKLELLKKEFLDIYERIKEQKEKPKGETKNKTEQPFYFFDCPEKASRPVFEGLVYNRRIANLRLRGNSKISKIREKRTTE